MVSSKKYFGTDGIRGLVGKPPITPDFMLRLGWAAGRVLAPGGDGQVIIGKDTRISGYMFESALEAGLSAAGVDIRLLGPMPTPAIAYLTRTLHAQAGIVISASHNAYCDNGVKFFSKDGSKLPDDIELAIEAELDRPMQTVSSDRLGKAQRMEDAAGRYIEFCKSSVPYGLSLKGLKIVIDCAHGATYHVAPSVFRELGAKVIAIGVEPDGLNINHGVGSTAPEALCECVSAHKADLGVAFDGDGDRVVMVDNQAEILDGDELLFIIAEARLDSRALNGAVVGTVMSNIGLEHALAARGLRLERAQVGDRHVLEMMQRGGWSLGGETSGHIICLDRMSTGDGIVAALQVLAGATGSGKTLHEMKKGMVKHPQLIVNVEVKRREGVTQAPVVRAAIEQAETELRNEGRVLLRPSGTEPVVRVMVEGRSREQVESVAQRLASAVREAAADNAA